jgi:transcriptional regulator
MYSLSYFKEKDQQRIFQFLHDHPFAFLTGSFKNGKQVATQIPMLVEEQDGQWVLRGHIMRKTDHHKAFEENPQALAMFTGPHTYVSGSWYSNSHIASTWNYMSVHIKGKISFLPEADLISLLQKLTLRFENNDSTSPTIYDNLPNEFLNKMLPAIIAFEIKAEEIDNVFKLSQNRDEQSYRNIITRLEEQGGDAALVAYEMKKRQEELFPPGVEWDGSKFLS